MEIKQYFALNDIMISCLNCQFNQEILKQIEGIGNLFNLNSEDNIKHLPLMFIV